MMKSTLYDPAGHARSILDLAAVLELIASRCRNETAREAVRTLLPTADRSWIESAMGEITETRALIGEVGDLAICDTGFFATIERTLANHGVIEPEELLAVARMERSVNDLRRYTDAGEAYDAVVSVIRGLIPHRDLVQTIEKSVGNEGEILDGASPELARLRKSIVSAREKLRKSAERLAGGYGDTAYATILDNRFKLLIPRDRYRRGEGIVHSTSHSGGSLYVEPMGMVESNNELETLVHDEQVEVARILASLTRRVAESLDELRSNCDSINRLDRLRASALFAERFNCITPQFSDTTDLAIVGGRHPLLEISLEREGGAESSAGVVPLDMKLGGDARVLVITGPNAGGKTVALKTLGIIVLMAQCGLPVPCREGTVLPLFERVFVDIGDEQSIATSLSTFTSHLQHLDMMCRRADAGSLCLIDEIGDGTDPDEGAALANATLDTLLASGAMVVATTHYGKVKIHAMSASGVANASMLFDDETQQPLYVLLQGVVGRSRGLETAERCGFLPPVLEEAKRFLGEKAFQLESLLSELETSHHKIEEEREALKQQSEELTRVIKLYSEREQTLRELQERHNEDATREKDEMLRHARREVERIVKEIRESGARKREIRDGHRRIREMIEQTERESKRVKAPPPKRAVQLAPGDIVSLNESGSPAGTVIEIQNDTATIEINGKRIKIKIESLFVVSKPQRETEQVTYDIEYEPLGSTSIDVRGREREEALESVDRFLDQALLNGVHEVTIIHGVGEGILASAIRSQLQADPRATSFRPGRAYEGGDGVTFVTLA